MTATPALLKFLGQAKLDAELSIRARRVLRYEAHTSSECIEVVWKPTQEFFEALVSQKPKYILCAKSRPFSPNQNEEQCVDVDILGPDGKTAYLGMVANTKQSLHVWTKYAKNCLEGAMICSDALPDASMRERFDEYVNGLNRLLDNGPLMIIRENIGCFIPVIAEELSRRAVERGARKMIAAMAPALSSLSIRWLPVTLETDFTRLVEKTARDTANRPTRQEREEAYRKDVE